MTNWEPNYQHIVAAARNQKPARLPLYEHAIDPDIMSKVLGEDVALHGQTSQDYQAFYTRLCRFWRHATYDTVSFEAGICPTLPDHGAIMGGRPGPIQNRADFERYPFDAIPDIFWDTWEPHLQALAAVLPAGMKLIGGCGYGVFEISEDLVGYEYLCLLQYDDPELFAELYHKIGDLMMALWSRLLARYGDLFAVLRMGDDLGFKSSTLLAPDTIVTHVVPQYRRIIGLAHGTGKPFLLHSCGRIFPVMDAVIEAGIDAKHSNEDQIAPFRNWIERYGDRIGLFGGIDVDVICRNSPQTVFDEVLRQGGEYRASARGYALGSGNSIPAYVPVEGYLAMVEAAQEIRRREENMR